ncbi:hypothetical protein GQX73_g8879 [Xylaria multiplex]|uniref:Protein kinase domain-containing protein n=1 Tax=Xylaria multiplex TaxID=323545 RepID=A0A7C8INQ3_9PEZI|nr:hypothetical protein GQX73_g8879 [Xylaria multiplex]
MSAELVLAVISLVEGSIKLVRKIKTTCQTYRRADEEINKKFVLVESLWVKIETQLEFLGKISGHLTDNLIQSQLDLLQRLKGKLTQAVSRLEDVNPKNSTNKGKKVDILRKWKFALIKSSLDELVTELEVWQQRFDPTWYLMILVSGKALDTVLAESTGGNLSQASKESNPLSKMLAIRSTMSRDVAAQSKSHVSLSPDGLKGAQELMISFTTARAVVRAGSSSLLIVERVSCPSRTTSQVKTDVANLAKKLQNVDPDSFGLLRFHYIHTCGFVHKNIRPENILVFPSGNDLFLGQSFLIGFTEFRNENFQTNLHGDAAWHRNLYRHPQRQGALVLERYVMQHDIYSLGVCLLEIGLWRTFVWYPTHNDAATPVPSMALGFNCSDKEFETMQPTGQQRIKEQLVALAEKELPARVGDAYTNIVLSCMGCLDPDNGTFGTGGVTDEDGITIGVKFVEHILSRIVEISV